MVASNLASSAVQCRQLVKEFGDGDNRLRVLHGIDLRVLAGEMTLLAGPSGCGKTTLISLIAGLLKPSEGSIEVFGVDQSQLSGRELVAYRGKNIGFVFQQYNLLPSLTATENVAIPLLILGTPRREALVQARAMLDQMDMSSRADALPAHLSGGQQQRAAIARALVHRPRLLVCDEPTAALDAHSGQLVMQLIKRVAVQPDRAVIVVTHDNRVFAHGDRMVEMADGRVTRVESTQQLT